MADTTKKTETPYTLESEQENDTDTRTDPSVSLGDENVAGFYITKSWYSRKNFGVFPERGYKPVYLNELSDALWLDFSRDVEHYHKYYSSISWFYHLCTIGPTFWFLFMVLPDLLWYYDVVVKGVGIICGLVMALTAAFDTYLQRRLLRKKIQPMYELLIDTYVSRFKLHGYNVSFRTERTALDGLNSYILFRKDIIASEEPQRPEPTAFGFYLDEDHLGKKPYALGMTSTTQTPKFLQGIDKETWKSFAHAIEERSKTPPKYLLGYTIAMGLVVGTFVFVICYVIIFFTAIRHWLLIVLVPLYFLVKAMQGFRRRHFVETDLENRMQALLKEFEPKFAAAGFVASFELEYVLSYFAVNTYFCFQKTKTYTATPLATVV